MLQHEYCSSEINVGKVFEMIQIQKEETSNDTDLKEKLQVRILNPLRDELRFVGEQNFTYDVMRTSKLGFLAELRI